ncbi:MAG: hypothetical protein R2727_08655 [Bacteroidales bacterium]
MDLLGRFDFNGEVPQFDFTMNLLDANLYRKIDSEDPSSRLSLLLTANFSGNNIDNIDGEIRILNSKFTRNDQSFDLYDASLKTGRVDSIYSIALRTDFLDADITGKYNLRSIMDDMASAAARLIPSLFAKEDELYRITNNNFVYDIRFQKQRPGKQFPGDGLKVA